jgi:hypothetical protein
MSKVFLIDLTMQWGMLKKHCDQNIGPLKHAFTHLQILMCESNHVLRNRYKSDYHNFQIKGPNM